MNALGHSARGVAVDPAFFCGVVLGSVEERGGEADRRPAQGFYEVSRDGLRLEPVRNGFGEQSMADGSLKGLVCHLVESGTADLCGRGIQDAAREP